MVKNEISNDLNNLVIKELFRLPFERYNLIQEIGSIIVKFQLKKIIKQFDIIWLTHPTLFGIIKGILPKNIKIIYDCMDDTIEILPKKCSFKIKEKIINDERELIKRSKIIFINNSIGPIITKDFEKKTTKVCEQADFISVRDKYSYDFLAQRGIKSIFCSDSVFLLYELLNKDYCLKSKVIKNNILGLSLLPFLELFYLDYQGQKMINNIARIISQLLEKNMYTIIRFFEFCSGTENDMGNFIKIVNLIHPKLRDKIQIINYSGDIKQFLNYMAECSFFICNRFHSIILALILKIPFLAIDHHPKVYNFLVNNKLEEFRIDYRKLLTSNCSYELIDLINSSNQQQRLSDKKLSELSKDALNNFSWLSLYNI